MSDGTHSIVYEDPYDEIEGSLGPESGTLAVGGFFYRPCGGHHIIPGGAEDAVQALEGFLVTQDGLGDFLRSRAVTNPAHYFERIVAHELGHAIGIDHPCEPEEAGCDDSHENWGALMWPLADPTDASPARLHSDDQTAVRYLYPFLELSGGDPDASACSGDTCLLQGERFRVKARYSKDGNPSQGAGAIAAALADSAGLFRADSDSPELLVRIVNQCRTTGYWEVHAGVASDADFSVAVRHVETNELKWFSVRGGRSIADTEAFACTRSDSRALPTEPGAGTDGAACSGVTCLLQDDRFRVKSWYTGDSGSSQAADAVSVDLGESAGLFTFDSGSPELLVRIVNRCSTSGHWEVYAGAASDADFSVAIRDTDTNELKWFRGRSGQSVADTETFSCTGSDDGTPPGGDPDASACSGDTCLLQGQRFRVKARYSKDGNPSQGAGAIAAALADSAGLFSAGSDSSELLVRIVNQCRTTGYWEVHAGVASDADFSVAVRHVETNELKWFSVRGGRSIADTEAFACTRSDSRALPTEPGAGTDGAACSGVTCLLQDDRFRVKSWYTGDSGSSQAADAVSVDLGESAGLFTFDSGSPELLVRIVNRCSTSGHWEVYAGAASDADFSVAIRDTDTNELKWFRSRGGQSVTDDEAFPCGGGGGSGFDLDPENTWPVGITYAGGFFFVVDWLDDRVYAYDNAGNRVPSRDFALVNRYPDGVAFANGRLYVVDDIADKVYAYLLSDGGRDAAAEFDLDSDNGAPRGIAYADGFFYVVDWLDEEVYAYDSAGNHVPSRDFALANRYPGGMAFANGRLYVVDDIADKVYAYLLSDGGRDAAAEFDLDSDNGAPRGITYAGGFFYVVDWLDEEVYAYGTGGNGSPAIFGAGRHLVGSDVPAGRYYSNPVSGCYWERRSDARTDLAGIISNNFVAFDANQEIVDILPTDLLFATDSDCRRWYDYAVGSTPEGQIRPGKWLVGSQITPGRYRVQASPGCYWELLRNFEGHLTSIIDNQFLPGGGTEYVDIHSSDTGFYADDDCGTWSRVGSASSSTARPSPSPATILRNLELDRDR